MIVDKQIADKRMSICDSCEHLKERLGIKTCGLCGCVMRIKIELNIAACPKGKW